MPVPLRRQFLRLSLCYRQHLNPLAPGRQGIRGKASWHQPSPIGAVHLLIEKELSDASAMMAPDCRRSRERKDDIAVYFKGVHFTIPRNLFRPY
jgi:hypothetical protein